MIGDIVPLTVTYEIAGIVGADYHKDFLGFQFLFLDNLHYYMKQIKSVQDIINNYQEVYEFIYNLSLFPQDLQFKSYVISDSSVNLSEWKSYKSDFYYYDSKQRKYNKFFKLSKVDYNNFIRRILPENINFIIWNYFEESEPVFSVK